MDILVDTQHEHGNGTLNRKTASVTLTVFLRTEKKPASVGMIKYIHFLVSLKHLGLHLLQLVRVSEYFKPVISFQRKGKLVSVWVAQELQQPIQN
jgi:hypothetical protein